MMACKYRSRDIFLVLIGLFIFLQAGCSKSDRGFDGTDESKDTTSPSAITDLIVTGMTSASVNLHWSAPGDNNDSGTVTAYDLRYLLKAITADNWDSAFSISDIPAPGTPHSAESTTVTNLTPDSTYYFAIRAVDNSENWSPLSNIVSATCMDNFAVSIADTALERVIRFYTGKPDGDIFRLDLLGLGSINAGGQHISSLSGIEYCRNLEALRLWNNKITDLSPLAGLVKLRVLNIGYNGLADIDPLASLAALDTLQLNSNHITDISALTNIDNLTDLELAYNEIWNLAPLAGKITIKNLAVDGNQIVFVNPLYNMTALEKLNLSNNEIDDLLPLAYNQGLGAGDTIWLTDNPLAAAATDSLLAVLRARGVTIVK